MMKDCGIITHHKILFFATPVLSFYICNKHLLITDIRLLQGTPKLLGNASVFWWKILSTESVKAIFQIYLVQPKFTG